jgi:hypothetical protein
MGVLITARTMARPSRWTTVMDGSSTIASTSEYIDCTVANFYLLGVWYSVLNHTKMRFMDMLAAVPIDQPEADMETVRTDHYISVENGCPVVPIGFIVDDGVQFLAIVFDFPRRKAHVLGCDICDDDMNVDGEDPHDWQAWNGPEYWDRAATLHGWDSGDLDDISVVSYEWRQHGIDRTATACSIMEQTIIHGLGEDGALPVDVSQVPCGHTLRIKILRIVAGQVKTSYNDYMILRESPPSSWKDDLPPEEEDLDEVRTGKYHAKCNLMLQTLAVISATCMTCKCHSASNQQVISNISIHQDPDIGTADDDMEGMDAHHDEDSYLGATLPEDRRTRLSQLLKVTKEISMARDRNSIVPRALGTHIPVESEQSTEDHGQDDSQRSSAAKASRKRVSNWSLGSIKRFPRPTAPPAMAAYTGRQWLPDDRNFDHYEGGPTIEMMRPPIDVHPTMIYHSSHMELSAAWVTWVDHGYRIKPSTFHMFYQCQPIATMEHIMPIGTLDSYDASIQVPDRVTGAYTLDRTGARQGHVRVNDVVIFSASEMIKSTEQYDPPLHEECRYGHDLFVRGCTSGLGGDERPIYVDLELDAIKFDTEDILISVDIDSIIWTTKMLRLRGTIGIYMTPPCHSKPGISKHNHTYLDLLIPQSEEDAHEPGGRTEWLSLRVKMDSIPHLCIGRISSAASTLNVYMFFPRLKHDDPISGKRVTIIPNDIEDTFWDRVLLPSIGDCADISWQAYMKQSLHEARYKNKGGPGATSGRRTSKIIPLSNDDFIDVQARMHERIKDGQMELSMFGSCFFVLEGKGIKLITKDGQRGRFLGPEEALLRNLPDLDWHHMMDRRHGELLVDVGISFTPRSADVPVVGLWRLDALEASFGAGGYNQGQLHHHNTLSRYGALQAEMQRERSQQTHVAFRSAYNLYYEAVRTTNNKVGFATDSDAYKTSSNYMMECFNLERVLTGSKDKTYGVRDEYRTSGKAARLILDSVISRVSVPQRVMVQC